MGLIYLATNMQNNKVYIGLTTKTLEWRINSHFNDSKRKTRKSHFHKALLKYDESTWVWITLQNNISDREELKTAEK